MAGKKVVLRKPKLDMSKPINLTPISVMAKPDLPIIKNQPNGKQNGKLQRNQQPSEPELEVQDEVIEEPKNILKTSSNRIIVATAIPEEIKPIQTFDDQFLDKISIKAQITRDDKTLEKLKKPTTQYPLSGKKKTKRKFNPFILISLILSIVLTFWSYLTLKDFYTMTDPSLASFIYVVSTVIITIMIYAWFIIEVFVKRRK